MSTIDLGTFEVTNGNLLVTDPCYTHGDCQVSVGDCVHGEWVVSAYKVPDPYGNNKVMELRASARGVSLDSLEPLRSVYEAGVDSGSMGIFNFERYLPGHDLVKSSSRKAAQDNSDGYNVGFGAFCSSGYGDGLYPVTLYVNKAGLVAGIKVSFDEPSDEEAEDE
jgi:hypothetical protein